MCAARRCVQVPSSWKMCKAWAHPFELLLPPLAPPLPAAWRHSGTRVRTRLAIPRARPARPRSAGGSSSSDAAASADTTTTAAARQHSRRLPRRRRRACERRVAASDRMPPPRRGAIAPASLRSTALTAPAHRACLPVELSHAARRREGGRVPATCRNLRRSRSSTQTAQVACRAPAGRTAHAPPILSFLSILIVGEALPGAIKSASRARAPAVSRGGRRACCGCMLLARLSAALQQQRARLIARSLSASAPEARERLREAQRALASHAQARPDEPGPEDCCNSGWCVCCKPLGGARRAQGGC